ncbi:MAG: hypothetical protein RH862_09420 [Leptospiraceae bacterium]
MNNPFGGSFEPLSFQAVSVRILNGLIRWSLISLAFALVGFCNPDDSAQQTKDNSDRRVRIVSVTDFFAASNPETDQVDLTRGHSINAMAWHLEKSQSYPVLRSKQEIILLLSRGSLKVQIDDERTTDLAEGEIIFLPRGQAFRLESVSPTAKVLLFHPGTEKPLETLGP